ncbi:hypothetical protein [Microbacterium sp. NPDC057650]|uniref:hypothetical protein n=1 Tax=unclassified Microbacterium TaxID=2609290 RepID=UPI00366B8577
MARGNGFEVRILSDTEPFERGIRDGIIDPLDDADKALEQLGDAAEDAGRSGGRGLERIGDEAKDAERGIDRLADSTEDAGRDGARAIDRLEDALKDAQRQAGKTEDAVDDIGEHGSRGLSRARDAAGEVTQEIGQNLGEAVSSVRENLSDLGQVGQDTLGGLAATLAGTGSAGGIAGAAAVAAGAVGLGLVTAELQKQQEQVQHLKKYFADAWQEAVEGGQKYISAATIIGEMNDIQFNPDRVDEYRELMKDVNTLGLDRTTILRAAAGDEDALNQVMQQSNALLKDNRDQIKKGNEEGYGSGERLMELSDEQVALKNANDKWRDRSNIFSELKARAAEAGKTMYEYVTGVGVATGATDDLGNAIYRLPDNTEVVVDAKTQQANTDVDAFEKNVQGVKDKNVTVTARTYVDDSAYKAFVQRMRDTTIKIKGRVVTTADGGWNG